MPQPLFQYQQKAEPLGPLSAAPSEPSADSWYPTWAQPSRLLRGVALLVAGVVAPVSTSAEAATADRTPPTFTQPSRAVRYAQGSHVVPVLAAPEAVTADRTPPTWSQPDRTPRYAAGSHVVVVSTSAESATVDRFAPTFAQPNRTPKYAAGTSAVGSPYPIPNADAPSCDWMPRHPDPRRTILRAAGTASVVPVSTSAESVTADRTPSVWPQPNRAIQYAAGSHVLTPFVEPPTADRWLATWPNPLRLQLRPLGSVVSPLTVPSASLDPFDWSIQGLQPSRATPSRPLGFLAGILDSIAPPEPAPSMDWLPRQPEPSRTVRYASGTAFVTSISQEAGGVTPPVLPDSLAGAIKQYWTANDLATLIAPLYVEGAQGGADLPMVKLDSIDEELPSPIIEMMAVELYFTVYHFTAEEARAAGRLIERHWGDPSEIPGESTNIVDRERLVWLTGSEILMERDSAIPAISNKMYKNNRPATYQLHYRCWLEGRP